MKPWECTRCGAMNSPIAMQCTCKRDSIQDDTEQQSKKIIDQMQKQRREIQPLPPYPHLRYT